MYKEGCSYTPSVGNYDVYNSGPPVTDAGNVMTNLADCAG